MPQETQGDVEGLSTKAGESCRSHPRTWRSCHILPSPAVPSQVPGPRVSGSHAGRWSEGLLGGFSELKLGPWDPLSWTLIFSPLLCISVRLHV